MGAALIASTVVAWVWTTDAPCTGQPDWPATVVVHDLGLLDQRSIAPFEVSIPFPGPGRLVIDDLWTSCGCTVAKPDERAIEAGGSLVVRGHVDTAQPGARSSEIFVRYHATGTGTATVAKVQYGVRYGWRATQPIVLGSGAAASRPAPTSADRFLLANDDAVEARRVESVTADCPGLAFSFDLQDRVLTLVPRMDASLPAGEYACMLSVRSDSVNAPLARIAASVVHHPQRFSTRPSALLAVVGPSTGGEIDVPAALHADGVPTLVRSARSLTEGTVIRLVEPSVPHAFVLRAYVSDALGESRRVRVLLDSERGPTIQELVIAVTSPSQAPRPPR